MLQSDIEINEDVSVHTLLDTRDVFDTCCTTLLPRSRKYALTRVPRNTETSSLLGHYLGAGSRLALMLQISNKCLHGSLGDQSVSICV